VVKKKQESLADLGNLLSSGIRSSSIYRYVPHDKQVIFHHANTKGRLYIGGNRSGKTVGGICEDIFRLRGNHPYQRVPNAPVRGRIVTVSYTEGIKLIILPELARWLPPSDLINGSWEDSYNKNDRLLTLSNGSTVELMSYDQKLEKFAGTSRHFVHFDEEPPKDIFDECKMRLMDTGGPWYITMTPVEGMTWVYDDLFLPGLVPGGTITVIIIDTAENPHISKEDMEETLAGLDANERKARKEGKFVQLGGLAFVKFNPDVHVLKDSFGDRELEKILGWTHYVSMDHGLHSHTAFLWHAVSPEGSVITYDELYDNERIVDSYAAEIHERNKFPGRRVPDMWVGDPAIEQRNAQTGDSIRTAYLKAGIPLLLGNNDQKIGVEKMNRYLEQGRWVIDPKCWNLVRQLQRVRWKIYDTPKKRRDNNPREELHKKDDHATDAARYFFSFMPDLHVPALPVGQNNGMSLQTLIGAKTVPVGRVGYYDDNLVREKPTEWNIIDEHLGGVW